MNKYERMRDHQQFLEDIEEAIANADGPNADGFVFELYGRGSLLEQAHNYVMHTFAGRRADRQFLVEASALLAECFIKAHRDLKMREPVRLHHHYAITTIKSDESDEGNVNVLEISGTYPTFTVGMVNPAINN